MSALALVIGTVWSTAYAADPAYPSRPIRLISPFTPGGGNDLV
jgi:tripartite-type tricarboxylate transporter receptor subunit TctC